MRGALWLVVLSGCSLTTLDWTPCERDTDCHEAFGFGTVCNADGLCDDAPDAPRCADVQPEGWLADAPRPDEVIVLGALADAVDDIAVYRSYALAVRQLEESGGLDGRSIVLAQCDYRPDATVDDLTREEAALESAGWLRAALDVPVFVGPSSSALTGAVWEAYHDGALVLSPSATSPALTYLDGLQKSDAAPGTLWRTAAPDSLQGNAIADDLVGLGANGVAVVAQTGPYGDGLADAFTDAFQDESHAVERFSFDSQTTLVDAVSDAGALAVGDYPWVLFISSEIGDSVAFLNAAAVQTGYAARGIYLTDGAADISLVEQTASASGLYDQVRGTRPWTPEGAVYEAYKASYAAAYDGQDPAAFAWTANAYDATWLAAYGIAWAHFQEVSTSPEAIGRGLRRISAGASIEVRPSGWADGVAAFELGDGIDVRGASGELDYDPATEETEAPVDVWVIGEEPAPHIETVATCYPDGSCIAAR